MYTFPSVLSTTFSIDLTPGPICHLKHIMHEKRYENNTVSSGKQRYD